ncbi:cation:proton antiporter [Cytophaga aurantiaca]|uniref:cation:proton antiporter n=1 Tax=Cytophaga aurantiaca TaxID=29530 RepID=UPI000367BFE3|nr:cation:proton antiporter [Cytophaga aurantiaca]
MNILITVCVLLLLAYLFDLTSSFTKIPSVILLLVSGWLVKQACYVFNITVPDLNPLLPVIGTVGLILIVLEGSLELDVDKTKFPMIKKSIVVAFLPMIILAALLGFFFQYIGGYTLKDSIAYAIPFCVISSAIAIPTVKTLHSRVREFVVFETSLSDILGVLLFNFVALNAVINTDSMIEFFVEISIITVLSFITTICLSLLLTKVDHHIKYSPIIIIIILFYGVSKIYHLPGLIFIMIFGLLLGNIKRISKLKFFRKINYKAIEVEVNKLHELSVEAAFLVRALFFLLFGFLMHTRDVLNTDTIWYAVGIITAILLIRLVQLLIYKIPLIPILFIAPRGLITILLFVALVPAPAGSIVGTSLVIQVIVLSALVMMVGLMFTPKELEAKNEEMK